MKAHPMVTATTGAACKGAIDLLVESPAGGI